ncbi:MAG: hypothetical protein WA324_27845 [Bryobacteraceae bacterium]
MAQEIVQNKESNPIIQPPQINSTARGSENIAKTLGAIAERSASKAGEYASEASKANLLQTHSMLQDVEANSKIEMLRSPGNSTTIAKNAQNTVDKIKGNARLNRADKLNLESMAQSTVRGLNLSAAEKSIALSREQAKYAALSSLGDTIQSIRNDLHTDPTKADALIQAQYESLAGQVHAGIITAVEAANIHKQLTAELEMAHELVSGIKEGVLTASDINAYHATDPGQIPMSNAHLPINQETAMNSNHYFGHLTLHDIQAKIANGERVSPKDLVLIKKISDLDKVLNYGAGAARATGEINSGTSWIQLKSRLDSLKKKEKLSSREEGEKNRLNNFIINAQEPGHYQNFIAGMPEGARAWQDYTQTQSAIDGDVMFGSEAQVAAAKQLRSNDNLNELISKSAAIGIGMHYPDYLRQPIPLPVLTPIVNSFNKDGDINQAIRNIQALNPKNRMYAMNAFPGNYRKQLTVYEIGNLADKADPGFMINLLSSQQVDALGEKNGKKDTQEKFFQLSRDKEGYSDQKLIGKITPSLTSITTYLSKQPNGGEVVSAKIDQAVRYVKKMAADHNDPTFQHIDDYIKTFQTNMDKAYGVSTGFNYVMDSVNVPLEDNQKQVLASHGINEVRQKLLEYKTPAQVETMFSVAPPIMVSSPGGRITVVDPNGSAIPDKNGHPAYDEIYSEGVWRKAEHDLETTNAKTYLKDKSLLTYLRAKPDITRPVVEGNIDLENRPKVWNEKGEYETVKTITREFDGKTVLLPTIINGKEVSVKQATDHYLKTGEHLGIFKNKKQADNYDKQLHERMGWIGASNKWEGK